MNTEATSLNKNGDGPISGYCRCNYGRDTSKIRGTYGRASVGHRVGGPLATLTFG